MGTARRLIQVSWERALDSQVNADHPSPTFVEPSAPESVLQRAARPVLESLSSELANEPVCIILTDSRGMVLQREGGDNALLRTLDKVHLAPGFSYAEAEVGTNGIGTALEVGAPIQVDGDDHYAGVLKVFSCAGALITHPTTGTLLGLIDITTPTRNSNPLLLSFARLAATRIQERVLEVANERDGALLAAYYAAGQHSGGPVIAVSEDVFMMSALAQQSFDANDQAALLGQAREAVGKLTPGTLMADLPSGISARLSYQPTLVEGTLAGAVIQITEQRASIAPRAPIQPLIGLAGTSPVWGHATQGVVDALSRNEWVVVQGEPGTGKLALLAAVHKGHAPMRHLAVVDAAIGGVDLVEHVSTELTSGVDVVIRHSHLLSSADLNGLAEVFQEVEAMSPAHDPWVALTTHEDQSETQAAMHLLHFFPRTVQIPPLRHHLEDLPELVRLLLNRAGAPNLMLSQRAINQLMRLSWPNNVTHLHTVLTSILRNQRSGVVNIESLPAECLATTGRKLSPMEALERDAIVAALRQLEGDKAAAAHSLGMSRATIYRKIREYGIVRSH